MIQIEHPYVLVRASSSKGKEAEGKGHFGRAPAGDRDLLLTDAAICLSGVRSLTSPSTESSGPLHPLYNSDVYFKKIK